MTAALSFRTEAIEVADALGLDDPAALTDDQLRALNLYLASFWTRAYEAGYDEGVAEGRSQRW